MKRTTAFSLAIALVVLTAGLGQAVIFGAPPDIKDAGGGAALPPPNEAAPPHIAACWNSGCLLGPGGNPLWPCGEDEIVLTVEGTTLHVAHHNAAYNCCPDDIVISASVQGNMIYLTEEEILTEPCWCICCYDVEATLVDLLPGEYTVELCWFDYDTNQVECYVEDIVIPPGGPGGPGDGGGLLPPNETPPPRVETCSNSGCLEDPFGTPLWPCGDDEIVLIAKPNTLHVLHTNAAYNCCLDDIVISVSVEGNMIYLTEEEVLTDWCYCVCCYDVEATVIDLSPGTYTVEFCWYDYDTNQEECYAEDVVIR